MIYQTRILKGLFYPDRTFFQLAKAEKIYGLRINLAWLFFISALIFTISGWFGVGSHFLSADLVKISSANYEALKSYFIFGRLLLGLLYATIVIFLLAFWFWTLSDIEYKKLVVLQAFVFPILLLEQASFILFAMKFSLPWYSSPLSLGVIAQAITSKKFLILFLGCISLFKIWVIAIQYRGLRALTLHSRIAVISMILAINLVYWALTAVFGFFNFKQIL